ncbi:TPA: RNA methyltransferase, partial [Streptococcus equi subsp. zooepidemicus]|nr:RNA methyltransferase [Streptococcus equi subsp. zooepidemicus]
ADQLIHISMPGQAESLNVAVAAGILIFSLI